MTYRYFTPEEIENIEGIDTPMIEPHLIPRGYVQHWDFTSHRYIIIHSKTGKKSLMYGMLPIYKNP